MSRSNPRRKAPRPGAGNAGDPAPRRLSETADCPCGAGKTYGECCGALHAGRAKAATAEQLMRSRYSAFAVGDRAYLLRSWHSSTRPVTLSLDPGTRWTGLRILSSVDGSAFHHEGGVVFEASYTDREGPGVMVEDSAFVREDGDWVYLSARG